jgi:hypothetical protein
MRHRIKKCIEWFGELVADRQAGLTPMLIGRSVAS